MQFALHRVTADNLYLGGVLVQMYVELYWDRSRNTWQKCPPMLDQDSPSVSVLNHPNLATAPNKAVATGKAKTNGSAREDDTGCRPSEVISPTSGLPDRAQRGGAMLGFCRHVRGGASEVSLITIAAANNALACAAKPLLRGPGGNHVPRQTTAAHP